MAEGVTGSHYTGTYRVPDGPTRANPPAPQVAQTAADVEYNRKLTMFAVWLSAGALFFAMVAAGASLYTAITIYRIIEGLREAFERAGL